MLAAALCWVGIEEGVEVFGGVFGRVFFGIVGDAAEGCTGAMTDFRDERAQTGDAEVVVRLLEVDGAGDLGVHGRAAEFFGGIFLADGGLDERRSGEEEAAALGHEDVVGHDGQIGAAGHAHAHDGGDLRDAHGGHDGVVAEDAAEVVLVGKDVFLKRQEDTGGVDEVERGDAVLHRDGLRAEDLLRGHGEEGPGFHRGVVGDDHAEACRRRGRGR